MNEKLEIRSGGVASGDDFKRARLTIYPNMRAAHTSISHFSFLISNFTYALVFCRRICYYENCISRQDRSSRKVRYIAKNSSDSQISLSNFNVVFSQIVDQKLPKLQQDKRIYHNTPVKCFLAGALFNKCLLMKIGWSIYGRLSRKWTKNSAAHMKMA